MKKIIIIFIAMGAMMANGGLRVESKVFYVSTAGNDSWTGLSAEPNKAKTDGPFATVKAAMNAIRDMREEDDGVKAPVTVMLRGGSYCQEKALIFTSEDSGTKDCPVTYQAYPGEKPVISGGKTISGWKPVKISRTGSPDLNIYAAEVPWVKDEDSIKFNQLFVNGERRIRARIPNKGEFFFVREPLPKPKDTKGFYFRKGEIRADWENIEDINITIYHSWVTSIHFISSVDAENGVVNIEPATNFPLGQWGLTQRYYVENVFEGLDSPGEWYLNKNTGILYYYPMPGEDMAKADVIAPGAAIKAILVDFKGNPLNGEFIVYLNFKGISFQHTNADISKKMQNSGQADINQNAMVTARGLRNSVFEKCEFAHTGEHAVWLRAGCQDDKIIQCHIHDMGGGYTLGVSPGTTERYNIIHDVYNFAPVSHGSGIYPDEGSSNILIENNIVYRVRTCPLFQHYGKDNIIRNNIFALGEAGQLQRSREDVPCSYIAEGNIVYGDNKEMLGGVWKNGDWKIGKNVYWCTTGQPRFVGMDFNGWKAFGKDEGSVVADPLFMDAKNGDFRLKPNSPAIKLGFVPIDTSKIGLYGDKEWVEFPQKYPDRKRNDIPLPPAIPKVSAPP